MTTEAEKAKRRRLEDEAEKRKAEFLGIPLPSFGLFGDDKTNLVSGVDVSPETLAEVKPSPPTGILAGEDQIFKDRLINYKSYPELGAGLLKEGINPEYARNVAMGKVSGVTIDDIGDRFQDPINNSLTDLMKEKAVLPSKSVMGGATPGASMPMTGEITSSVLGDIYDLGSKDTATTGMDLAGMESMAGLLGKVIMMRGLLDNNSQKPMAAAPRGAPGLNLQRQDLYKRYRG